MARTWLSIRVDLVHGRGEDFWPRPGRIFAAARRHTFAQLADATDDGFPRWDQAHLHDFTLGDGTRLTTPYVDWEDAEPALDDRRTMLARLRRGEQFVYVFDFGDDWTHLCTVAAERIDPLDELGILPEGPLPYWGWGDIPDQYGRRWDATTASRLRSRPSRWCTRLSASSSRDVYAAAAIAITSSGWAVGSASALASDSTLM